MLPAHAAQSKENDMFTKHDFNDLGGFTIGLWAKKYKEILSIFDLQRLQESMHAFVELENADEDGELIAASEDERNPDAAVIAAFDRLYSRVFVTLYDRGVLAPFMVLEEVPEGAQRQLDAMAGEVESHRARKAARQQAPVAPVVVAENPVDVCVREFHELGSNAFKTKWLNNSKNRMYYERAIEAGRI
jgi:hypothetical protein